MINIPGCPAHPDWITQILVALATGRTSDIALDELQRPQTFFKTFTQTGCTRVQFYEYKQSTMSFGEGTRTGCLFYEFGCRGPMTHSPCNRILWNRQSSKTRAGQPCYGCTEPEFPHFDLAPGTVFKTQKVAGVIPKEVGPAPRSSPTWPTPPRPGSPRRSGPKKTCSWSSHVAHDQTDPDKFWRTSLMTALDLHVSPLGRVEGDLDVRVTIEDGVVTSAWTEAAMFRGFEIILRGKDPQAGLIVTPRICGICGGSHLYKSAYALDTAWGTHLPPNATLIRNIAQALRDAAVHPAVLLRAVRHRPDQQELRQVDDVRRGRPPLRALRRHQLPEGCGAVPEAGRGLRDLRWAVAALQLHGARRRDGRPDAVRCHPLDRDPGELEGQLARVRPAGLQHRPLAGEQDLGRRSGLGRRKRVAVQQRHGVLHPLLPRRRPGQVRPGRGQLHLHGHLLRPVAVPATRPSKAATRR